MSDYDPKRMDPKRPAVNEAGYAADRGFNWNWVIGGIAALAVLLIALTFMGGDDQTADTGQPPATTGQASPSSSPSKPSSTSNPAPTTPNASPSTTPAERTAPPPASPKQ